MDTLWAPWRMTYIQSASDAGSGCIFCQLIQQTNDSDNLILMRGTHGLVMLNRYPYAYAHLLIIPYAHEKDLEALTPEAHDDLFRMTTRMSVLMKRTVQPEGLNVGLNLGRVAGAGIDSHLHVHIVPRWQGDHNFMPVLADCKVMGEHLLVTYDRLRTQLSALEHRP